MADSAPMDGDDLGGDDLGGEVDVPQEFVDAGAPSSLSAWTDEQKDAYFRGEAGELIEGETPARLEVMPIGGDDPETGS